MLTVFRRNLAMLLTIFDMTDAAVVAKGAEAVLQELGTGKLSGLANNTGSQLRGYSLSCPLQSSMGRPK
jgi:hypothetical protein